MKTSAMILFVLGCATVCLARRTKDYTFDVTGTVSAEDGTALSNVEVILQVGTPVYEGVQPVNTQSVVTSKGAFIFRCLSHSPSTKYSITVRRDGYEPQTLSGTAPPDGTFTIRLKKAKVAGNGKRVPETSRLAQTLPFMFASPTKEHVH